MAFLEERMNEQFSFGSGVSEAFAVDIVETVSGNEYRRANHPFPRLQIDLDFNNKTETYILQYIEDLFRRSNGRFGGFRWKHPSHYSTNSNTGTPTYNDQACELSSAGVYQAMVWYGTEGGSTSTKRRLKKIVASTMLVGIRDDNGDPTQITQTGVSPIRWTVDENTGLITFAANQTYNITNITQAAQAVITVGANSLAVGDSIHISVVTGMTEINGKRGTITAINSGDITVDINSSAFTAYTSSPVSGVVNTRPQTNETVTCGCQFDIPVRFESDISGLTYRTKNDSDVFMSLGVQLVEILNP